MQYCGLLQCIKRRKSSEPTFTTKEPQHLTKRLCCTQTAATVTNQAGQEWKKRTSFQR